MHDIAIGIVPRDRCAVAALCIQRLLKVTPRPFHLFVVVDRFPERYGNEIERAAAEHPDVSFLRSDQHLPPNAAKNWVVQASRGCQWLALVENDNLVHPGWLEKLIGACVEQDADVGRPMLLERRHGITRSHFDARMGSIERVDGDAMRFRILPRTAPVAADRKAGRQIVTLLEAHALLFRRATLERIGPFDERVTTRVEVDLSLQLLDANARIVFEPTALVTYLSPPPIQREERAYFYERWDRAKAEASHRVILEKWKVAGFPSSLQFVRGRHEYVSYPRYFFYQSYFVPRMFIRGLRNLRQRLGA